MNDCPKVTIITPIHRDRNTLLQTIESVCTQTYPNIQYIINDDGPYCVDDSISDTVAAYGTIKEFRLIHNQENMGISYTLNRAIEESDGEYVFNIADDDCFYDENVIMDWVQEFIRTGALVMTAKRAVYDNSMSEELGIDPPQIMIDRINNLSCMELFEQMSGHNYISGCVTAKKRELFDEWYGKYIEDYRTIEDYPSNMLLLRNEVKIFFFDRIVLKYRSGGASSAVNIDKLYFEESDRIFYREIYPYVRSKLRALFKYHWWKHSVRKYKKMSKQQSRS